MRLLSKATVGTVVGASALVVGALPAGAASQRFNEMRHIDFTHNGNSLTCYVAGDTRYDTDEVSERTGVNSQTHADVFPDTEDCDAALRVVRVRLTYVREDGEVVSAGSQDDTHANIDLAFDGIPSSSEITHVAEFACDDNPSGVCSLSFTVHPK